MDIWITPIPLPCPHGLWILPNHYENWNSWLLIRPFFGIHFIKKGQFVKGYEPEPLSDANSVN